MSKVRCRVLKGMTARTPKGPRVLSPGQTIAIESRLAAPYIQAGKLAPIGHVVYKVWSELLQKHILVAETDRDKAIIPNPENLVIYSPAEIRELAKLRGKREDLKVWNEAKKLLKGDIVAVERKDNKSGRA